MKAVLRHLQLLPEGQAAESEHVAIVGRVIDGEQAYLEAEGIAYWEASDIPQIVFIAIRDYMAGRAATELLSPEEALPYLSLIDGALLRMRRATSKPDAQVRAQFY